MGDEVEHPPTRRQGQSGSNPAVMDTPEEVDVQVLVDSNRELEAAVYKLTREVLSSQFPEILEWEKTKKELRRLREEEEPLPERKDRLQQSLREVSRRNVEKVEEIRRFTARILKLTEAAKQEFGPRGEEAEWDDQTGQDPRETFAEEIWDDVFGKLTDPRDLWNCYNTCTVFQRILHPWKSTWAFEKALPYLFPHLSGHDLLDCRLVSIGWKKVVDNFLQDHPSFHPHNDDTCNPRHLPFVNPQMEKGLVNQFNFKGSNLHNPQANLEDPEWTSKTHRCLALGRSARLSIEIYEARQNEKNEEMWEKIYRFMRIFGQHIWYLSVSVFEKSQMFSTPPASTWVKQKMIRFLTSDLFELASVVTLVLASKHHEQLGRLKVDKPPWNHFRDFEWNWLSLRELHLNVDDLDTLSSLTRMELPRISKLGLSFSETITNWDGVEEPLQLTDLLQALKLVLTGTRVTTLRLDESIYNLRSTANQEDQEGAAQPAPVVMMPSTLKTLELENTGGIFPHPNYQKLLPHFPHLENLNVFYRDTTVKCEVVLQLLRPRYTLYQGFAEGLEKKEARQVCEREVVEVNRFLYTGEMYKSNIWELLPQLEVFTFQWEVYTRGGYVEYRGRKKRVEDTN